MDHEPKTVENIVVTDSGAAIVQDFKLTKRAVSPASSESVAPLVSDSNIPQETVIKTLSEDGFLTPPEFNYHHYDDLQVGIDAESNIYQFRSRCFRLENL